MGVTKEQLEAALVMILLLFLAICSVVPQYAEGHGNMVWPPSWFDPNGEIGLTPGGFADWDSSPISWFSNWTFIPGEPTIDPSLLTVPDFHGDSYTIWDRAQCVSILVDFNICRAWYPINPSHNPWMAPGSAVATTWERGTSAEVGWGMIANHGGGYSYRLCKVGLDGPGGVTEECFQKTPLRFASEDSWV